ncbi:MAG: 3-oxoacyl-[acyl-carrier-protein] reductase [Phycisphaeraceae bacterium]|jgi:3-oxoacyl-[acyl-carrier protein] reductase|nr:3-oxoacyl-[acyl-carrier-protein] reductase [Phycisphaeraceae bacterium]MDP7347492.1 3-oxoacyl-[acyl-carrier-protein] reductase [Phycisphaeraceae bacterium]
MADDNSQRVALVTGASRGIGAAIGHALAQAGRHVVLCARDQDKLDQVKQQIESTGGSASVHTCDVSDGEAVTALVESVAGEHGRLDILVNNAGITRDNLLLRMTDDEFDAVMQTNMRSVFVACRAVLRPMMRGKFGRIVNIGSVAGLVGNAGQTNYAAAKAAIAGFTRSLAREMAAKKITANVVAPGFIETEMTDVLPDKVKELVKGATPVGRFGLPDDIAACVAFLSSDQAGYITGQVVAVDGGMTMC